jgi:short-subunit dehydrogenase
MFPNPESILITGASSGIGEALALHYARAGITLFLGGRNADRLESVASACREQGAEVLTWIGDVTQEAEVRQWIQHSDQHRPLNLVIANAGIALGATQVEELHPVATETLNANVTGVLNTVHPALEVMARRRPYPVTDAQVALMSSIMGYAGVARSPAYSASKAAVKHYGEALRGAFRNMGVGVSVICPGYVGTPLLGGPDASMPFMISSEKAAKIIARGLARNKARITFPWQVLLIARVVMNLPNFLVDRINRPWKVPRMEDS